MISKNKRKFLMFGIIRLVFPVAERLSPFIAKRWARKLFFTPIRFEPPSRELEVISKLEKFELEVNSVKIQGYLGGKGPRILLMHGWAGRFGQFSEIVESLIAEGFQVIGIDAPGHGQSGGKETNLLEFSTAIETVIKHKGPIDGAIGHSMGAVALLLAKKNGVEIPKIITIGMPSISSGIITEFLKKIRGSQKTGEGLREEVLKKFNKSFDDFSAIKIVSNDFPKSDIMMVHDENDQDAPMYHFWEIIKLFPSAKTMITKGLGHNRILRDRRVAIEIIEYLKNTEQVKQSMNNQVLQEK
jgi:hypothetical protein